MVCVSFPIVMTNGSTERHHELLQRIRKEHPMITQLNLRKQLNIINLVLSHDRMEEVQIIRNKILAECGEPLPISQEDMQKVFAYQDLAKLKLADVLRPSDGEALVFDEMVSATNTRLAVVGVRASNDDRRGEIISNVMMLLGLKQVEHTSIAYTKGTVVDVAATTRDSLATLSSSEPPPSPIAPAVSTTSGAPRNKDNDEDEDDLDDLMRDIDQQLVAANPDQAPVQSPTVPRDEHEQILADIQVACASGYPEADTQASFDPTDAMKAANAIIADLTKLVPPSVRFAVRGPQTIRVTLRSSPRQTGGKKVTEAATTTSNATLLADVKSSVYRRCGCVMELIFTQPWLVKIVAKRSTTFCSHIKRCTRTTDQEHLQVVQAPPLIMMDGQVSQMKVALYGAVSAERHAFLAEQFQQCVDNTITVDDLMLTPQVVKALADECNVAVLASFMYDDLVQSASILGLTADIERFRQQADLHFDNFT